MEFLDPRQKRKHNVKLLIGYGLMTTLVIMGTLLMSSLSLGFNFDTKTGSVIQNGLLFIDSHPESASAIINGQDKGKTNVRLVMPSGRYGIVLKQDGYRDWNHDINLEGGSIERLLYPFLFPAELKSEDSDIFSEKPIMASQSPDRRWLVLKQPGSPTEFKLIDLNEKTIETSPILLDKSLLNSNGTTHNYDEVEWSNDNKHLLLKHTFEGGSEFLVIDRTDAGKSVNLNTKYNWPITDVRLRDKKYDKYYFHNITNGELVSAELSSETVIAVANGVLKFQPHGSEQILYVHENKDNKESVEVILRDQGKNYEIRQIPVSNKYLIDLAQFDGKWYIALGSSTDQKVYIYIDPLKDLTRTNKRSPLPSALLRLNKNIEFLSFSANARFISIQSGSNFAVYDAETVRQFRYDVDLDIDQKYKAKWMDGHRFFVVTQGKMHVFDFDGTNSQELLNAYNEFYPFFDRDYNNLFTLSPSTTVKDKPALVFTPMRFDSKQN